MAYIANTLDNLVKQTAFLNLTVGNYIMIAVACFFLFLAIKKDYVATCYSPRRLPTKYHRR